MKHSITVRMLNIVFAVGLIGLFAWFVISDINPSGKRIIEYSADRATSLITGPKPADRVIGEYGTGDSRYWEIAVDPIYFDLFIPRLYQQITMEVVYQTERQELLELGGLGAGTGWQITLKPGQNLVLDGLDWPCQTFGNIRFCQNPELQEIMDWHDVFSFIDKARGRRVLTYHYTFPIDVTFDTEPWTIDTDIRRYDFLVTSYHTPLDISGGWKHMSAEFSANELWLSGHTYKFMISAPELDKHSGRLRIKSVRFVLEKEPITPANFRSKLQRFWKRNLSKFGL